MFQRGGGPPLLSSKIESNYEIVAQVLFEVCDAGSIYSTEANVLKGEVDVSGWIGKLLGGVGLASSTPSLNASSNPRLPTSAFQANNSPAIPWRRPNVKHTSNELYIDIVERLSVILAPSGRPITALAIGSILCTSKLSGVPELNITLSRSRSTERNINKIIELPAFHPCVRLSRWKREPGTLSFIPPDGKFVLAGYEVNLMPNHLTRDIWATFDLDIPVRVMIVKSLGSTGHDFEARLRVASSKVASIKAGDRLDPGTSQQGQRTNSASNPLKTVVVHIPLPALVRNIKNLAASRGETSYLVKENIIEWRLLAKDTMPDSTATLRCTVAAEYVQPEDSNEDGSEAGANDKPHAKSSSDIQSMDQYAYDEALDGHEDISASAIHEAQQDTSTPPSKGKSRSTATQQKPTSRQGAALMPTSATISFAVKNWLPSGIKVESINVDTKRSQGLGEGVKPYKGVKYLTISERDIEVRC